MKRSIPEHQSTREVAIAADAAVSGDPDDSKYEKIRKHQSQFRRSVLTVVVIAIFAFGGVYLYTNVTEEQLNVMESKIKSTKGTNLKSNKISSNESTNGSASIDVVRRIGEEQSEAELEETFRALDAEVRKIKQTGVIMEADPHSLEMTGKLQVAARNLLIKRYGKPPYRLKMDLEFQESENEHIDDSNRYATLLIEMAPIHLIPYSVFNFLEIARGYQSGGFHRNAGHVLQAAVKTQYVKQHLAFQEYSENFPHAKGTVGYCGRPSGVCWYVSILDNTKNHGPGSQQKKNPYEADANWGTVIEGMDDVVPRIHKMMKKNRFLDKKEDWVLVNAMHILVADGAGGFKEWKTI